MHFEYDPAKSRSNRTKHGIDFDEAKLIWQDVDRLEVPAQSATEPRFAVIGRVAEKVWAAFITYRGESIRLISVRRARASEERAYYEQK